MHVTAEFHYFKIFGRRCDGRESAIFLSRPKLRVRLGLEDRLVMVRTFGISKVARISTGR
jgi:hypothetical protein